MKYNSWFQFHLVSSSLHSTCMYVAPPHPSAGPAGRGFRNGSALLSSLGLAVDTAALLRKKFFLHVRLSIRHLAYVFIFFRFDSSFAPSLLILFFILISSSSSHHRAFCYMLHYMNSFFLLGFGSVFPLLHRLPLSLFLRIAVRKVILCGVEGRGAVVGGRGRLAVVVLPEGGVFA